MSDISHFNKFISVVAVEKSKQTSNNAQEQEINDLIEFLKLEQSKYLQQKILFDVIDDIIKENDLEEKLKTKVQNIVLSENLKQTLNIEDDVLNGEVTLLDVNKDHEELTYLESNSLSNLLKVKLTRDVENLIELHTDWAILLENNRDLGPIQLNTEDKVLLEYRNKVTIEQEKYITNLINLHELLEDIANKRIVELPNIMEQKIKECQVEDKINHLKFTLAQEKCRVDIFTETSCSLKAYKEVIKDLMEQHRECQKDIELLTELKEKYKQVSCKQYDDILKSYLQCKSLLEKKKILYHSLKS